MSKSNLLKLKITNFKKIESVDIDFQGRSFLLVGKNRVGKTSFIQALKILFNIDQMPPNPVTDGKEKGSMSTVFEKNGVRYNVEYQFTNDKATFKFTSEDGMPIQKPKTVLDTMTGPFVDIFDIIKKQKYAEGRRDNEKMFLKLANLDADKVYKFDADIKLNENNRLEVGREVTRLQGVVDSANVDLNFTEPIDLDAIYKKYMQEISDKQIPETGAYQKKDAVLTELKDRAALVEKLNILRETATEIERKEKAIQSNAKFINENELKIADMQEQIKKLQEINAEFSNKNKQLLQDINHKETVFTAGRLAKADLDAMEAHNKEVTARAQTVFEQELFLISERNEQTKDAVGKSMQVEVDAAIEHNKKCEAAVSFIKTRADLESYQIAYEDLTRDIVKLRDTRHDYIMTGAFPIDGMEYTDEGIKYNGMLLDEGVMSTSDIIELGIKLSNAYNPDGLNFMPIPNASLFDKEHIDLVQEFLQKNGLIGAFEMVDRVQDKLTIEFLA